MQPACAKARDQALDQCQVHATDDLGVLGGQAVERAVAQPDGAVLVVPRLETVLAQRVLRGLSRTLQAGISGRPAAPAEVGTDPRNECDDQGIASCGSDGVCDGAGACRRYPAGVICKQPSCTGSTMTLAYRCDGAGACLPTSGQPCDPFVCGASCGCGSKGARRGSSSATTG